VDLVAAVSFASFEVTIVVSSIPTGMIGQSTTPRSGAEIWTSGRAKPVHHPGTPGGS
jgi:hypothetical protein